MSSIVKGKNYSKNNTGGRSPRDFYQTPRSMTDALFDLPDMKYIKTPILEPAVGKGAIVHAIMPFLAHLNDIVAYDLQPGVGFDGPRDFLKETRKFPTIITNPPFSLALEFIKKSKEVATHTFALLMDLEYLHGSQRFREVYSVCDHWPLSSVNVFVRRPMLLPTLRKDGFYNTGMTTYAWYIWSHSFHTQRSAPIIRWIDNDAFVLRKRQGGSS